MKFLADMGISQTTVKWLNKQGGDAIHVRDVGMYRSLDAEILSNDIFVNNKDLPHPPVISNINRLFPP